jgi:hypothetical protein
VHRTGAPLLCQASAPTSNWLFLAERAGMPSSWATNSPFEAVGVNL